MEKGLIREGDKVGIRKRCTSVFLISSYGTPLPQRAPYLALHSSFFGPVAQLIMLILSQTALTPC